MHAFPNLDATGDNRAGLDDADWSVGDFKGQCADGSAAKGICKDANGNVRSVLCCPVIRLQ